MVSEGLLIAQENILKELSENKGVDLEHDLFFLVSQVYWCGVANGEETPESYLVQLIECILEKYGNTKPIGKKDE